MTLALLDIIGDYVSPSKSTSKQWASPCPFCQGTNRFVILPYGSVHNGKEMPPHAFCRQCGAWVTAEMLLQKKEGISWHDAHAIVEGAKSIEEVSTTGQRWSGKAKKLTPAIIEGAPWQEWQWSAEWFYQTCKKILWSEQGEKALQWLRERGLSDESIDSHDFGFNPQDYMADWGTCEKIKLYRGIVIPYLGEGQVWKIEFRRATNIKDQRYRTVAGSANALYGYEGLEFKGKAVMVEGVFDAVAMEQALRIADVAMVVVATGSTNGSWESRWKMKLALCDRVVVAMDSDEGGEKAARYWLRRLEDSRRWVPAHGDVNAMWLKDRAGLVDACLAGFVPRKPCRVCAAASVGEDCYGRPWCAEHMPVKATADFESLEEYCYECGDEVEMYDLYQRAWCALHAPGEPLPVVEVEEEALSNPAISDNEKLTTPADQPAETIHEPVVSPAIPAQPRKRKEKAKTAGMCSTDGCYGIGKEQDVLEGKWCENCKLRRELVDGMAVLGFPRLEYSPGHFIESGEDAVKGFAKAMSPVAIGLACREIAGEAEKAVV